MVRTQVSPTGIETEAWIWVRACQVVCASGAFITGCVEGHNFLFLFLLLFPVWLLSIWNLVDASVFYKKRYTRGAGSISILRTLTDWFINCLLGVTFPFCFIGNDFYGSYYYHQGEVFMWTIFGFVMANECFYFASAVMLSVEDARMRKNGRLVGPSATEAMPNNGDLMYRGMDIEAYSKMTTVDSQTASTLVNNMLRNGFTVRQIALMGSQQVSGSNEMPEVAHSPSPAIATTPPATPPIRTRFHEKSSPYEPAPPHYD